MFTPNSVRLLKKREGILGQFTKAVNGLRKVNDEIIVAQDASLVSIDTLQKQVDMERSELESLESQKKINAKTIKKIEEFLV